MAYRAKSLSCSKCSSHNTTNFTNTAYQNLRIKQYRKKTYNQNDNVNTCQWKHCKCLKTLKLMTLLKITTKKVLHGFLIGLTWKRGWTYWISNHSLTVVVDLNLCFTAFLMTPIMIPSSSSISLHAFFKPLYFVGVLRPSHSLLLW